MSPWKSAPGTGTRVEDLGCAGGGEPCVGPGRQGFCVHSSPVAAPSRSHSSHPPPRGVPPFQTACIKSREVLCGGMGEAATWWLRPCPLPFIQPHSRKTDESPSRQEETSFSIPMMGAHWNPPSPSYSSGQPGPHPRGSGAWSPEMQPPPPSTHTWPRSWFPGWGQGGGPWLLMRFEQWLKCGPSTSPGCLPMYSPPIISWAPSGEEGRPVRWESPRQAPGEPMPSSCRDPQVGDTQSPDGAGGWGLGGPALGVCPRLQVQKLLPQRSSQSSDCGHRLVAWVLGVGLRLRLC